MNFNFGIITAISYFISRLTTSSVLISEFEPNPPSSDPSTQTIEFYSNSLSNFDGCFISIESDNSNTGIIDRASDFSCTFDNNGLCTISINDLENPSFTVAVYDTNDLDCSTITTGTTTINDITATPLDALGSPDESSDEQYLYGATLGGQDFKYTGEEPAIVFRDGSNGEWFAVHSQDDTIYDIDANLIDESLFNRNATVTTFGKINPQLINEMSTTTIASSDISTSTSAPIPTLTGVTSTVSSNPDTTSGISSADTTLESTIPDTTAPRSTLPDTTLLDTTVPDTTVLVTAPGSTAPGSTATGTTPPGTTEASEMEPTSMSSSSVSSSMAPNQMKTTLQQSVTSVTSKTSMASMASITSTESMNEKLITSTASTTPYMTSMTSTQSMKPPADFILSSMTSTKPIISMHMHMDTTEDKTEIMMTEDISTTELDTKTNNAPSKHYGLLINQFITFIFVYLLFCVY